MTSDSRHKWGRLGARPPRYAFVLNPHAAARFSMCPACNKPTRIRKLVLVIHVEHVEGARLLILNKACRLCVVCEMLIAHQTEVERLIAASGLGSSGRPAYVVLGTVGRRVWRRGLGGVRLSDVREHMVDFKGYMRIDVTPAHWEHSNRSTG